MQPVNIWGSSGYVSPIILRRGCVNDGFDVWIDGDSDASTFHTLPGLTFRNSLNGEQILAVARKACELFSGSDLFSFIHANMMYNRFKTDLHYRFLDDTINFIKTGKRGMSIFTWMQLLIVPSKSFTKKVAPKTTYSMKLDCYRGVSVMRWLKHDGGLQDLIISLYIIFGKY